MPGLDPGIHGETQCTVPYVRLLLLNRFMDCRVKPGNDERWAWAAKKTERDSTPCCGANKNKSAAARLGRAAAPDVSAPCQANELESPHQDENKQDDDDQAEP